MSISVLLLPRIPGLTGQSRKISRYPESFIALERCKHLTFLFNVVQYPLRDVRKKNAHVILVDIIELHGQLLLAAS
jgi:hypothetical protein